MNQTVNINLGGVFFHIDEDAYQKLNRYFDAIKRSLSNSSGQDEIMKDIELRVSELFGERQTSDKSVISIKDVDAMIAVMGQPEDYRIEEEGEPASYSKQEKKSRKLYRDIDKNVLGGVAAGFGHYFGIDALWIRLLLVFLVIAGVGFPIIIYLVLWVLVPKALTTTEKLEMTGEPVNLSNIEKKVREEFASISDKVENADYDKMGTNVKTGAEKIASSIGEIFMSIFSIFAKIIGAFIVIIAIFTLGGLLVSLFTFGTTTFVDMPWQGYYDAVIVSEFPIWLIAILSFFAIGIPFFFLLILGLKLLITNMKSIGNVAKYTLLALWLITVGTLISFGIKQATEVAHNGKTVEKQILNITTSDTLQIKFKYNEFYAKNFRHTDFEITENPDGKTVIYSNNIRFEINKTDELQPYLLVERKAEGKSISDAKKRAENIIYNFTFQENTLLLDNYFLTDLRNKFRDQEVELYLYLPEGIQFKTDESVQRYDISDNEVFNLHFSSDAYTYKVSKNKVLCLNCPTDENDFNDIERNENDSIKTISVKINDKEIMRTESNSRKFKLEIDENGIIKKTN